MLNEYQLQANENPFEGAFQQGVDQFISYEKNIDENYKSRQFKNKERVQKLIQHVHEERKEKRKQRRELDKKKLYEVIEHMTYEERRAHIDSIKAAKIQKKVRVREAMATGQIIILDLVYEGKMNIKQNRSLGSQIQLIMKAIKHVEIPPSIHLCSFKDGIKSHLEKMRYEHWAVTAHEEDVSTFGKFINKRLIYLSPDAPQTLDSIEQNDAFILGGLIDRSVLKDASLMRAKDLGIESRSLPITQYMRGRICLNLDHVVSMLCKFKETRDWKKAFDYSAPKRWKKEDGKEEQNENSESSECQDSQQFEENNKKESFPYGQQTQAELQHVN